jgi:hypothetical protein
MQDTGSIDATLLLAQPHAPQARRHRAFARGEHRSDQPNFGVLPNGIGKERRKLSHQRPQLGRQCQQRKDAFWRRGFPQLTRPAAFFSRTQKWPKSSSTPTISFNLLQKQSIPSSSPSGGAAPHSRPCYMRQSTIPPPVMRDNCGYRRQYRFLPLSAYGVLSGM